VPSVQPILQKSAKHLETLKSPDHSLRKPQLQSDRMFRSIEHHSMAKISPEASIFDNRNDVLYQSMNRGPQSSAALKSITESRASQSPQIKDNTLSSGRAMAESSNDDPYGTK